MGRKVVEKVKKAKKKSFRKEIFEECYEVISELKRKGEKADDKTDYRYKALSLTLIMFLYSTNRTVLFMLGLILGLCIDVYLFLLIH